MTRPLLTTLAATLVLAAALPAAGSAQSAKLTVVAAHLNQPKKLSLVANGDLLVALSGDGKSPASCTDSSQASCNDHSGAIDAVSPAGQVVALETGLSSISASHTDTQATGPSEALVSGNRLQVLFQDLDLNARTGVSSFGASSLLGDLVSYAAGSTTATIEASFGTYEAVHEPDRSVLGSAITYGYEGAINSDPYSVVAYRGGYAVADAGANDVLWVSPAGAISVLAVLPTIREYAAKGTFGTKQTKAIEAAAQAVPTALAVGSDGSLYVGELGGSPFRTGTESIYRIVPGHKATVYAKGLTSISDIAFDAHGNLLVLELDKKGLTDPGLDKGTPASGVLLSIAANGTRRTLISSGLSMPAGIAVDQSLVYITNDSTTTGGGEILRYSES